MILFSHPLAEVRPSEALHQVDQLSSTIFWRLRISSLCFLCIILCLQEIDLRTQDDGNLSLQIQPLISVVFPSCPDKVPWEECVEAAGVIFYYLPWWVVFATLFCREPQYHVHFHWAVTEQIIHSALKKRSVPCWPVNLDPVSANSKAAIGMDLSNSSWNDVCPMQSLDVVLFLSSAKLCEEWKKKKKKRRRYRKGQYEKVILIIVKDFFTLFVVTPYFTIVFLHL